MVLSSSRRFGGIFLISIGFIYFIVGFAMMFLNNTFIVNLASLLFSGLQIGIFLGGLIIVFFGLFFIWAGRMIRNEPFLPEFLRKI